MLKFNENYKDVIHMKASGRVEKQSQSFEDTLAWALKYADDNSNQLIPELLAVATDIELYIKDTQT